MLSGHVYARAFHNARAGLLLLEPASGRVVEVNAAFLRVARRPANEVVGRNFWEPPLVADAVAGAEIHQHLRAGATVEGVELPMENGDGSLQLLELCGGPAGDLVQLEVRDITPREQARLAERMETLRAIAVGAAREFRGLHGTLRMIGETLLAAIVRGRPVPRELEEVQQASARASAIAAQLDAFGGKPACEVRPLSLNNLIQSTLPRLRQLFGRDIEIIQDLGSDLAPVLADAVQLRQIVLRLAANSRDAMARGGTFCLQTRNASGMEPGLSGSEAGGGSYVMLALSDDGPGFDDQSWAHLFEPFFSTKTPGGNLGLGLAAVHGTVRQWGGRLWAYSQPGKGATFRIYLPQPKAEFPALMPVPVATVLLVEANDQMRTAMANLLKKNGYHVLAALHVEEAWRIVQAQGPPDLLISHTEPELTERLSRIQPELRVLYLTGYGEATQAESSRMSILRNPFDPEALLAAAKDLLA